MTDKDGAYSFSGLVKGRYNVLVFMKGDLPTHKRVDLTPDQILDTSAVKALEDSGFIKQIYG